MTRKEWKAERRRIWWRKNEDKVIGAAMAPIALAMMGFVVKEPLIPTYLINKKRKSCGLRRNIVVVRNPVLDGV